MVVDFDGRILAQADPGPGEKIVVSEVDIGALRHVRKRRAGHHTLAHLRSEAYPMYGQPYYPQGSFSAEGNHTVAMNEERITEVKQRINRQP